METLSPKNHEGVTSGLTPPTPSHTQIAGENDLKVCLFAQKQCKFTLFHSIHIKPLCLSALRASQTQDLQEKKAAVLFLQQSANQWAGRWVSVGRLQKLENCVFTRCAAMSVSVTCYVPTGDVLAGWLYGGLSPGKDTGTTNSSPDWWSHANMWASSPVQVWWQWPFFPDFLPWTQPWISNELIYTMLALQLLPLLLVQHCIWEFFLLWN